MNIIIGLGVGFYVAGAGWQLAQTIQFVIWMRSTFRCPPPPSQYRRFLIASAVMILLWPIPASLKLVHCIRGREDIG